jgi:hypothetical protein
MTITVKFKGTNELLFEAEDAERFAIWILERMRIRKQTPSLPCAEDAFDIEWVP